MCHLRIFDQCLRPLVTLPSPSPLPWPPKNLAFTLIKLDQDDINNWLKLGPVHTLNDPYLTPFVETVSLFLHHAPFGMVYLGSVINVLALSPLNMT